MGLHLTTPTPPITGELVVRRGPDRGTSRALLVPVTLIGHAEHCDLRILDFLVRPVHCVVSVTPEGPHMRSLGGTTLVNDVPTQERLLQHGDYLTIGPIELEVRWYLPPAPIPSSSIVDPSSTSVAHEAHDQLATPWPMRKIARMKQRLARGRLQLARERLALRQNVVQQLSEVSELRHEGERLKVEAVSELTHLRQLRRQFLTQWKRYWRRKRVQLEHDRHELQQAHEELARQQQQLHDEQQQFATEKATLQQAHDECRQRCERLEHELAQRTADLNQREADLHTREQHHAQRIAYAHELHTEIAGLEARVQHLRSSLPHDAPIMPPLVTVPPVNERLQTLQTIATTLADQQHALVQQMQTLMHTSDEHRQTHASLVHELEALTEDVLRREHDLERAERTIAEQQQYLEVWQARLLDQQIAVEQQATLAEQKQQQANRHDATLKKLAQRWAERRRSELAILRTELEQLATFRGHLEHQRHTLLERDAQLLQEMHQLLVERRAFEQQREGLPHTLSTDRYERRLQALFAKRADEQQATLHAIQAESTALQALHDQTQQRLLALAAEQREWSATLTAHEQREALRMPTISIEHESQLASAERYINELRAEIQRLTHLLDSPPPLVGPRWAA